MPKEFGVSNRNGDSWRFQPNGKALSNDGAFLVYPPPPESHGGGVLLGLSGSNPRIYPSEILGTNPRNLTQFFRDLRNPGELNYTGNTSWPLWSAVT